MADYKGCIVEESLNDNLIINDIYILKVRITNEDNPAQRWHIYNSIVSEDEIDRLHKVLKSGWYMHFWSNDRMIVLFKGKKFILDIHDKDSWRPAIDYGLSMNIPIEQLDFDIEF